MMRSNFLKIYNRFPITAQNNLEVRFSYYGRDHFLFHTIKLAMICHLFLKDETDLIVLLTFTTEPILEFQVKN